MVRKIPNNTLITFVSRDPGLNLNGINELIADPKLGGVSRIYVLYDGRKNKKGDPVDGWAEISVANKTDLIHKLGPFKKIDIHEVEVDPNKIIEYFRDIFVKESKEENEIYLDATSLRRVTIAKLSFLITFFKVKIFLVVPDELYDLTKTFTEKDGEMIPLANWSTNQEGKLEMIDVPKIGYPKLRKVPIKIIKILSTGKYDSTKSLKSDLQMKITESRLRDNLRKLRDIGVIKYEKDGKLISTIELTFFGKLLAEIPSFKIS